MEVEISLLVYVYCYRLATTLVGISLEPKFGEISLTKQELDYGKWNQRSQLINPIDKSNVCSDTDDVSNRPVDVHFYYESVTTTSDGHGQSRSCKRGNAVVITARCEPNAPKDKVQVTEQSNITSLCILISEIRDQNEITLDVIILCYNYPLY